jgi:hypothetical protein
MSESLFLSSVGFRLGQHTEKVDSKGDEEEEKVFLVFHFIHFSYRNLFIEWTCPRKKGSEVLFFIPKKIVLLATRRDFLEIPKNIIQISLFRAYQPFEEYFVSFLLELLREDKHYRGREIAFEGVFPSGNNATTLLFHFLLPLLSQHFHEET